MTEPQFSPRSLANRAICLAVNVPALPYVWLRFPDEFPRYARNVGNCLLTGRGNA